MRRYDIEMQKMLRRMISPPVGIDWSAPWHVILHSWHARTQTVAHQFAFLPWSAVVTIKYWKFAAYIQTLPPQKWWRRCLDWTPPNNRRGGRPPFAWVRRYVPSSAGNNSVVGKKHRLKPGIVSNQSWWPSLLAGSDSVFFV